MQAIKKSVALTMSDEELVKAFPQERTWQGYCYKIPLTFEEWNALDNDIVVYIGEYGYIHKNGEYGDIIGVKHDYLSSKQDILDLFIEENTTEENKNTGAYEVYAICDWQSPETLYYEMEFDWDVED